MKANWMKFMTSVVLVGCLASAMAAAEAPKKMKKAMAAHGMLVASEWIDVTAPLDPATLPVYTGDVPLTLEFKLDMRKGDKVTYSTMEMGLHSGTHVDAPMHFIKDGVSMDKIPLSLFMGPVLVIDCSVTADAVDAAELNKHKWRGAKRIFFRTRNSHGGGMADPHFNEKFVYIAPDAAQLLADAGVELVGIDYNSVEKFHSAVPRTHQILLGKGIPAVEGLDLRNVTGGEYELLLLPARVIGHETAPVRALMRKM